MASSSWVFLIVAIFVSISLINCQNFKKFKEKHIVEDQAKINCNITIKDRNLNRDSCRYRNTFIHDTEARKILQLCSPYMESTTVPSGTITLTDCKLLKKPSPDIGCAYNQTGLKGVAYVTCERQVPVHFDRFEPSLAVQSAPCVWTFSLLILHRGFF